MSFSTNFYDSGSVVSKGPFGRGGKYSPVAQDEESLVVKENSNSFGVAFKITALVVLSYSIAELAAAMYANVSLALLMDGFRNLSEFISMLITYQAQKVAASGPSKGLSFGWIRLEIVGGLMNGFFLLALCLYAALEAIPRFVELQTVGGMTATIVIGVLGIVMCLLKLAVFECVIKFDDVDESNMIFKSHSYRNATISLLILVCGIPFGTEWDELIDPIVCLIIIGLVTYTTIPLIKRNAMVVLQSTPSTIDVNGLRHEIGGVHHVLDVHDLHVWELVNGVVLASVHVTCEKGSKMKDLIPSVKQIFHRHGIHSATIQPEFSSHLHNDKFCSQNCVENCDGDWCCKRLADVSSAHSHKSNELELSVKTHL